MMLVTGQFKGVIIGLSLLAFTLVAAATNASAEPQARSFTGTSVQAPAQARGIPISQDEGHRQANAFWGQRLVSCGDQYYLGYPGDEVKAMKGLVINVQTDTLTEAEKLNGLQWKGVTSLKANASRTFLTTTGWQPWENGIGFGDFSVSITERNGRWVITPSPYSAVGKVKKISCSDVPPEIIAAGSPWAIRMLQTTKCSNFMAIDRGYMELANIKTWIEGQVPLNLNTCRSETDGTTPLMKAALTWGPEITQLFLQHGADPKAVDNSGRTAVQLVEARRNEYVRTYGVSPPPLAGGMMPPDHAWLAVIQILNNYDSKRN